MTDIGWGRRRGSSPAARRGAQRRAGLTHASAPNTLPCQHELLHSKQLSQSKNPIDSDHGIYRGENPEPGKDVTESLTPRPELENGQDSSRTSAADFVVVHVVVPA
jgi:hypothetical protein